MDDSKELKEEFKRVRTQIPLDFLHNCCTTTTTTGHTRTRTYDAFDGPLQVENQELTARQE
jgi:hypothetical protein